MNLENLELMLADFGGRVIYRGGSHIIICNGKNHWFIDTTGKTEQHHSNCHTWRPPCCQSKPART